MQNGLGRGSGARTGDPTGATVCFRAHGSDNGVESPAQGISAAREPWLGAMPAHDIRPRPAGSDSTATPRFAKPSPTRAACSLARLHNSSRMRRSVQRPAGTAPPSKPLRATIQLLLPFRPGGLLRRETNQTWRPARRAGEAATPLKWLYASMLTLTAPHEEKYQDDASCNPKNDL